MSIRETTQEQRDRLWEIHPLIHATARISTIPTLRAYKRIKMRARRARKSIAFWANPLTGKSYAIEVIVKLLRRDYPGCGIVSYEATSKSKNRDEITAKEQVWVPTSLGGFIDSILDAVNFEPRHRRSLSDKKQQLKGVLYTLAAETGRLFFIVDEAQELIEAELCWLKEIINFLSKKHISVMIVLFGQEELKKRRQLLKTEGRSDLWIRFMAVLYEFAGIRNPEELRAFLKQCDDHSEFPEGSGLSYTHFLWPKAFEAGFRLTSCTKHLWDALTEVAPLSKTRKWIKMQWVAHAISEFADLTKNRDGTRFESTAQLWKTAVKMTDYEQDTLVA
jgi:hypothetical protein